MARPWWTLAAGVGIVVGLAYTWRALQKAFFSDAAPQVQHHYLTLPDPLQAMAAITSPEVTGTALLVAVSLVVGLYPRILLDTIEPAVRVLLAGGGR